MKELIRKKPALAAMAAALLLLIPAAALLPPAPVWITDVGNKYMIMRNFAETGQLEMRHHMPGTFPTGGFHFKPTEKGYRSFYPELLPAASSYCYRICGDTGAVLIPLVCGVLLAGLCGWFFHSFPVAMLTLFATPCAFYSLMLWEMIPAVLAGFCGVIMLGKRRFFTGGLILALGLFMREELYFLGAASGLALLFLKEYRALLPLSGGFLCGMAPVWLVQYLLTGHVLGVHGSTYYLNNRTGTDLVSEISGVFWNYYQHLFRFEMMPVLMLPVILLLLVALCRRDRQMQNTGVFLLCCASGVFLWGALQYSGQTSLCYAAALSAGFISTLPVCWPFWARWKEMLFRSPWRNRLFAGIVIAYTVLVPPLLTRNDVGLFWGARHFLFVMPLAVYLAWKASKSIPRRKIIFAVCAALSVFWQLCGFNALVKVSDESDRFTAVMLENSSRIIVSDVFFLPEQTPKLFFERDFCEVVSVPQLEALVSGMRAKGIRDCVFVTSPKYSRLAPETRQKLARYFLPGKSFKFESSASGFMELVAVQLFLKD